MSLQTILNNVYNFVEILQTACSLRVSSWNTDSLKNAFKWANYCKQISEHGEGKYYEAQLINHIAEIGNLPWAIGDRKISLPELRHAEHTLKQALLQNPHVPDDVYGLLLSTYGDIRTFPKSLQEDLNKMRSPKQMNEVLSVCLSCIDKSIVETTEDYAVAALFLKHAHSLLAQKPSRQQRCQEILIEKLDTVAKTSNGMNLICLMCSMPCTVEKETQIFIVNWIISTQSFKSIIELDAKLLAEVSSIHYEFFQFYIKFLCNESEIKECTIDKNGLPEFKLNGSIDYNGLVQRIRSLLQCGEPVSTATSNIVHQFKLEDKTGLWRKLSQVIDTCSA